MSNYILLGLYDHNIESYEKIVKVFEKENIVGIVHATGTGKSYNALQLALDNKDKKIIYITPSNGIIEHLKKIINDNPNLDLKKDFPNLEFRTYQSLINLSKEELSNLPCELLILDEFHHLGAPVWGSRINTLIETHENIKVLGMTAYTIRDRNTPYERDMANPDTNELFSNKIVSRYDLCDAMIDGLLPKPIYKTAYTNLLEIEEHLESKINKLPQESIEYKEYMLILKNIKRRINDAPSIPNILKKTLKPNGKYIYFCPPFSEEGTNDIETIKSQTLEYLKEFINEEDIEVYTTTSEMGELGQKNRDAFYNDKDLKRQDTKNKLRIMFAINQYNEGVHAPNIDGVIMGRGTTSDIVYFEQLGRALSVRGNTLEMYNKYETYSKEELINLCREKEIPIKENISKEELIEKLIAPIVIDLTNNYEYIKELENNLKDRVKEIQRHNSTSTKRKIKLLDTSFDIEIENEDIFEMLKRLNERLTMTWEDYYDLAKVYYEHHGDLEVKAKFKTNNGYEYSEFGKINLGYWIFCQRRKLSPEGERGQKLLQIGMRFENINSTLSWEKMYNYAKAYYEHHGDLEVQQKFKTSNGYEYDEFGTINLGTWIFRQRQKNSPESEQGQKLLQIGMRFENIRSTLSWDEMYNYAKKYYEYNGDLKVKATFKTNNGYEYNETGKIILGRWIFNQKRITTPESEKGQKLLKIGMRFETKKINKLSWDEMYDYAKKYYEHHGNLEVPYNFKTSNGYEYDEFGTISLGHWIYTQRKKLKQKSEKGQKLLKIGMRFEVREINRLGWEKMYEYAKKYYEHYGDLEVKAKFKTNNGYEYSEFGKINLGQWISVQKKKIAPESERGQKLLQIGMCFENKRNNWDEMYEYAKKYYEHHGDLEVSARFKTNNGYEQSENGKITLGQWIYTQRRRTNLESERGQKLLQIGMRFDNKFLNWEETYEYAKKYYEYYGNLEVQRKFKTNNGYEYDEHGTINLGQWILNQRQITPQDSEKGRLLTEIGMVWSVKNNQNQVQEICNVNNININVNKDILSHISIQELISKIEYLKANNIKLTDNSGKLHQIFNINSVDLEKYYGISFEDLIATYYLDKIKDKKLVRKPKDN